MMEWNEINRRLKNGTSVQVLADLDGTTYKTMYNRIKYYERRDGKQYLKPEHLRHEKKKKDSPEADKEKPEPASEVIEVPISELITCKYCKHVSHRHNEPFCTRGHVYGVNDSCSEWTVEGKVAPDIPEAVPEVAKGFAGISVCGALYDEIKGRIAYYTLHAAQMKKMADEYAEILNYLIRRGGNDG